MQKKKIDIITHFNIKKQIIKFARSTDILLNIESINRKTYGTFRHLNAIRYEIIIYYHGILFIKIQIKLFLFIGIRSNFKNAINE